VKINIKFSKIFSGTSRINSNKLYTNHLWIKPVQVCSNKGAGSHHRGGKNRVGSLENLLKNF
jgi:hypothetical protein